MSPVRLSAEDVQSVLAKVGHATSPDGIFQTLQALGRHSNPPSSLSMARDSLSLHVCDSVIVTDVFIAGSGPIASAYARTIIDASDNDKVLMVEIGAQDSPVIGAHQKNAVKFQKDIDAFVHTIKGALQTTSVPVPDSYQSTLGIVSWAPDPTNEMFTKGFNPCQKPHVNLPGNAITRTVGGMGTHWTCACPEPHPEEMSENPIEKQELRGLLDRGKALLNVRNDQFDQSIRHRVVKKTLTDSLAGASREVKSLPLAAKRCTDNKAYVNWSGADTILGEALSRHHDHPRFTLRAETRVTKLYYTPTEHGNVIAFAQIRDLKADRDYFVIAKAYVVACGSVCTPQILWNSNIRSEALGRNLTEQSLTFCQIVLKRSIVNSIRNNADYEEQIKNHREQHPCDPLPIPFDDPEPQVTIPYDSKYPWHIQIHRDAFSYGGVGPRSDPRVVVDLRFFGKSDIVDTNMVTFNEKYTDIYGMPQATFNVTRTEEDGKRDHKMMRDMVNIANILGAYLPGSEPRFMEPGLALHITGTTRIGTDPKTSVADPSSKVHGYPNLWVGGNGCIPDSTACNPTLTSVAIAIKGAESVVAYLRRIGK